MSDTTTNLQLSYLAPGQAQKHVTVNESLRLLDAIVQLVVTSATTTAEPGSPSDGAVYIVPSGKTGSHWASFTNWALGYYRDGAWVQIAPRTGWLAWVRDTSKFVYYTGSAWSDLPAGSAAAGAWAFSGVISPAQITANTNDYAPTGLASATVLRLNTDASRNLTGLTGGAAGRLVVIHNVGSFNLVVKNADSGSTAANRFAISADVTLTPDQSLALIYDATSSRWRLFGGSGSGGGGGTVTDLPSSLTLSGDISPSQITSNQNDYSPTGLSTATVLRVNTDASRNLTGLAGGADGRIAVILNIGSFNLVLKNADSGSSTGNRFAIGADLTLGADQGVALIYDSTSSRWRLLVTPGGGASVAKAGDTMTGPLIVNAGSGFTPSTAGLVLRSDDGGANGPFFVTYHNSSSPAANDTITGLLFEANNTTPSAQIFASIQVTAGNMTAGSEASHYGFYTYVSGVQNARFFVKAGVYTLAATGGDQGVGSGNFTAVYDDAVLLCAPLWMDDPEKQTQAFWDDLVPNRRIVTEEVAVDLPAEVTVEPAEIDATTGEVLKPERRVETRPAQRAVLQAAQDEVVVTRHRTAKRYFDMMAEGFDARDPDIYFARLVSDRAVPGLPTLEEHEQRYPVVDGERVALDKYSIHERTERTQLALDFMAQAMAAVFERVKAQEARLGALEGLGNAAEPVKG